MLVSAADPYGLVDLAPPLPDGISRFYGSEGDGRWGVPVCGGYDVDGDGFKDYAFSQILADPLGRNNAGTVTLIFGDGTLAGETDTAGFASPILKIAGDQPSEITGAEIWMDDVNGDGLGDLIIGRQNYSFDDRDCAGALTILLGHSDWRIEAGKLTYFDLRLGEGGTPLPHTFTIVGASSGDRLGIWMRTGDGVADIAVGADQMDGAGEANRGGVYVIQGGAHLSSALDVVDLSDFGNEDFAAEMLGKVALIVPPADAGGYHLGGTVQIGDLDCNGRAEVLAAAALNRAGASLGRAGCVAFGSGGTTDGTLFIVWDENFPDTTWPNGYTFAADAALLGDTTRIDGETANGSFGEEILAGGDYSGDGIPDLFVGDLVGNSPNGSNSGLGYVFYNAVNLRGLSFSMNTPPASLDFSRIYGPVIGAIGADTVAHGDFDRDGFTDLALGNPHDNPQGRAGAGSVHIFYGQPGGWPELIDLKPGNLPNHDAMRIVQVDGAQAGDTLCYSAAAGDLDDDGYADFIVNEMTGNGFGGTPIDVGNLLVISGRTLGAASPSDLVVRYGETHFGSVAIGDLIEGIVLIQNVGSSSLTFYQSGPLLGGFNADQFAITQDNGGFQLNAGELRVILFHFNPTQTGPAAAVLSIKADQEDIPLRIPVTGIGISPQILIEPRYLFLNSDRVVSFGSVLGRTYQLRRSFNLREWHIVSDGILGTGGPIVLPDSALMPATMRAFHQVLSESP